VMIRASGIEGWVNAGYLDSTVPVGTLPLINVP
jgi:hypothetical protein